jgi:hypothetical protein
MWLHSKNLPDSTWLPVASKSMPGLRIMLLCASSFDWFIIRKINTFIWKTVSRCIAYMHACKTRQDKTTDYRNSL